MRTITSRANSWRVPPDGIISGDKDARWGLVARGGVSTVIFLARATFFFCVSVSSATAATMPAGPIRLPVIDKQDIRFVRLSVGGEPFRKWVTAIAQDDFGFI